MTASASTAIADGSESSRRCVPAKGGDTLLVIRLGMLGLKSVAISTREVFEIVPRDRRLWLRTPESVSVGATDSTPELLEPQRARVAA